MWGNLLSHVTGQETPPELPEFLKQRGGLSGYPIIPASHLPTSVSPATHISSPYTSGPTTGQLAAQPLGLPRSHQKSIRCLTNLMQSVPVSSQASTCSLFHQECSSVWIPPLIALPPRCQPLRKELPVSIPPPSLICFKTCFSVSQGTTLLTCL